MKPPIGHTTAIALLQSAIAHKTHYNFLIHGPDGIGKTALARWAASLFLGTDHLSGHPDLLEIMPTVKEGNDLVPSPEGIIRMEQLRNEVLDLQPVLAPHRVVIIQDVHKAGSNLNTLLKAMEDRLVFILITDQPQLLLETVRSRCLSVTCTKLNEVGMAQVLRVISPQTLEMEWLLKMVPGQPGRAVTLHQHLHAMGATLLGRIESAIAGAPDYELMVLAGLIGALGKPIQLSLLSVLEYLCWQKTHDPEVLKLTGEAHQQISIIKQCQLPWYLLLCKLPAYSINIPLVPLPEEVPIEELDLKPIKDKQKSRASATSVPNEGNKEKAKSTARGSNQKQEGQKKAVKGATQVNLLSL